MNETIIKSLANIAVDISASKSITEVNENIDKALTVIHDNPNFKFMYDGLTNLKNKYKL